MIVAFEWFDLDVLCTLVMLSPSMSSMVTLERTVWCTVREELIHLLTG